MSTLKTLILGASLIVLSQCSRPEAKPPAVQASGWVLLVAPQLMDKNRDSEPCTGMPYVRAPLADWEKLGQFNSFQECAAAISERKPDTEPNHQEGRLTPAERMLGFKCVLAADARLSSPPPYNWKAETAADQ